MNEATESKVIEHERARDVIDLVPPLATNLPAPTNGGVIALKKARYTEDTQIINMLGGIAKLVEQPGERFDVALEKYLQVQRIVGKRYFDEAMAQASQEFPPIIERGVVFRKGAGSHPTPADITYTYPLWEDIDKAYKPILGAYGFRYRFLFRAEGRIIHVTCRMSHDKGYEEDTELPFPLEGPPHTNGAQQIASTTTFGMRTTFKGAIGGIRSHPPDDLNELCSHNRRRTEDQDGRDAGPPRDEPTTALVKTAAFITDDQFNHLWSLISTPENEKRLMEKVGMPGQKLGGIPAARYDEVLKVVEAWRARQEESRAKRTVPGSASMDDAPPPASQPVPIGQAVTEKADAKTVASSILDDMREGREPTVDGEEVFDEDAWLHEIRTRCQDCNSPTAIGAIEKDIAKDQGVVSQQCYQVAKGYAQTRYDELMKARSASARQRPKRS